MKLKGSQNIYIRNALLKNELKIEKFVIMTKEEFAEFI